MASFISPLTSATFIRLLEHFLRSPKFIVRSTSLYTGGKSFFDSVDNTWVHLAKTPILSSSEDIVGTGFSNGFKVGGFTFFLD